ncbi:LOW QUALITY PROTEIN: hypothetical protein CRUP_038532 [Coryphaenoides rupestris]|nr:LOW QUALITY PROTEIN: hypothetical protein CRUP_038532 [Coryphaenoides rupestris]
MGFSLVGGYWDKSCSTVTQLKEGLNRILCLIPYNVISQPLWECFMPEWLEAIRTEVPDHQLIPYNVISQPLWECFMHFAPSLPPPPPPPSPPSNWGPTPHAPGITPQDPANYNPHTRPQTPTPQAPTPQAPPHIHTQPRVAAGSSLRNVAAGLTRANSTGLGSRHMTMTSKRTSHTVFSHLVTNWGLSFSTRLPTSSSSM